MIRIALFTAIALSPTIAAAETPSGPTKGEPTKLELCASFGEMAEQVMLARQSGAAPSALMAVMIKPANGEPLNEIITKMITIAYDVPRYTSDKFVKRAAQDFRAEAETGCLK